MIELAKSLVGIKFLFENTDLKNYIFNVENDYSSINIQYNDTTDQFNFFIGDLFYNDPNFINIKYKEDYLDIKTDIFNKKFDLNVSHKINSFVKFKEDPFKKLNLVNNNFNKNLQVKNKLSNTNIESNLYKMLNGSIETSLDLSGKINEFNYFINFDTQDNMIISLDYQNSFGLGIKKTEDYNSLNFFNNFNFKDDNIKWNYNYYDKNTETNHESAFIYTNDFLNCKLGGSFMTKSLDEISLVAVGFKIGEYREIDNLELNYSYDLQQNKDDLEGLIEFNLKDIICSNYFNYFDSDFHSLGTIKRYLKKIDKN